MILTVTLNASIDKHYEIDHLVPNTVMRIKSVSNTAGGKGLNVSRIAALAGEDVVAMGFVGGFNGMLFERLLDYPRIEKAFTHIAGETRCCINICDNDSTKSTEFLEPGNLVTEIEMDHFINDFKEHVRLADVVVLSGSLPQGVPVDIYTSLIRISRDAGIPVFVDSSGEALRKAIQANPDFIKPNEDELCFLTGTKAESIDGIIESTEKLHSNGIPTVAVSLGRKGVIVSGNEGVFYGETVDVEVVNTVGCGDSMTAGFAIGLSRGMSLQERIRYAVAISTANALSYETGVFKQSDLDELLPEVKISRVK